MKAIELIDSDELLDELYEYTLIEEKETLNEVAIERYVSIYDILMLRGVEIPFGIEI